MDTLRADLRQLELGAKAESCRGYRVYGTDGYSGVVDGAVRHRDGTLAGLTVRSGLFVRRYDFVDAETVATVDRAHRRLDLRDPELAL